MSWQQKIAQHQHSLRIGLFFDESGLVLLLLSLLEYSLFCIWKPFLFSGILSFLKFITDVILSIMQIQPFPKELRFLLLENGKKIQG